MLDGFRIENRFLYLNLSGCLCTFGVQKSIGKGKFFGREKHSYSVKKSCIESRKKRGKNV